MIIYIDKSYIYSTFNVDSFLELEQTLDTMPPSLLDYHLESLLNYGDDSIPLNRTNIEHSINVEKYSIYHDYEDKYFFEKFDTQDEYETTSLW